MRELEELRNKNINIYPIKELVFTKEKNYNLDRIKSLNDLNSNLVYNSVLRCLEILDTKKTKFKNIIAQTLLWMDVAKSGSKKDIQEWKKLGFNLFTHNIGSAEIYKKYSSSYDEIIYILIKTHGLIGQYLKGEVNLNTNKELYSLIEKQLLTKEELREILLILNECIIKEVSTKIYEREEKNIYEVVDKIVNNKMDEKIDIVKRLELLNGGILEDEKNVINKIIENKEIKEKLENVFEKCELWYYGSALKFLSVDKQIKVLLLISNYVESNTQITFENLMKDMYLNYKNVKRINIYKQRIIENYLDQMSYEQIINKKVKGNINITYSVRRYKTTLEFDFRFSKVATKLIEFCEVAYSSGNLYNKSVILLYDLFGFRKDNYDRFYNEIEYLETMNSTIIHKAKLLEFISGNNVLDVGPGGGALMDLILDTYSDKNVYGIDISNNVIEELNKKKIKENRNYKLVKGNALNLEDYFEKGSIDTIIYSSIIHELFSYIEYNGKKFNHDVIVKTLKSAYSIIPVKGRIIIRDGIMSDKTLKRIIEFKNKNDMNILKRYKNDFKGRNIEYEILSDNKVKMNINDAMEFLYTYTWGEESYSLEVQEQFGYYTKDEYEQVVMDNLENAKIIYSSSFLQDGYEENLLNRISFYDENNNTVKLPDSTYILVIEKGE